MATGQSGNHFFAEADITTATTTTLVSAVAGFSIVVERLLMTLSAAAFTAKFQSSAGSVAISPVFDVAGIYSSSTDKATPLMSTALGSSLQLVSAGTPGTIRVMITYRLVAE